MTFREGGSKKIPVSVYSDEFKLLIENTPKLNFKIAFLLGYGSGMRISEIVNLTKGEVNLKEKSILIRQGKGGKDRVVPLPKGFRDKYLDLIPLQVGIRTLQKAFKESCRRAGLLEKKPDLHFHSLRHGFGYRCISEGIPIHHLRTLMGHTNISTTNIYLEANPVDALKSYEDLF